MRMESSTALLLLQVRSDYFKRRLLLMFIPKIGQIPHLYEISFSSNFNGTVTLTPVMN